MRADLESGRDSRCDRPGSLVDSVEIRRLNVTEDPLVPVFDRRFYIFTLRPHNKWKMLEIALKLDRMEFSVATTNA